MKQYTAIKLAENFRSVELSDDSGLFVITNYEKTLNAMATLGWALITVDNGIAYFEQE